MASDPVSDYVGALDDYNAGRQPDEDVFIATLERMDQWQPDSALAFVRKFHAVFCDGGAPTLERLNRMLAQAAWIIGQATNPPSIVARDDGPPTAAAPNEMDSRDRESVVIHYLEALLRNVEEDLRTACNGLSAGTSEALSYGDACAGLGMAFEYVQELGCLAGRPIAGMRQPA